MEETFFRGGALETDFTRGGVLLLARVPRTCVMKSYTFENAFQLQHTIIHLCESSFFEIQWSWVRARVSSLSMYYNLKKWTKRKMNCSIMRLTLIAKNELSLFCFHRKWVQSFRNFKKSYEIFPSAYDLDFFFIILHIFLHQMELLYRPNTPIFKKI